MEAAREAIYLKGLTNAVFTSVKWPITLIGDNKGWIDLAKNMVFYTRTKHIELKHRFIIEVVERGIVKVVRVGIKDMLADGFTKALLKDTFKNYIARIGVERRDLDGKMAIVMKVKKRKWECAHCDRFFVNMVGLSLHMVEYDKMQNSSVLNLFLSILYFAVLV